jgi:hypothetical protein
MTQTEFDKIFLEAISEHYCVYSNSQDEIIMTYLVDDEDGVVVGIKINLRERTFWFSSEAFGGLLEDKMGCKLSYREGHPLLVSSVERVLGLYGFEVV